MTKPKPWPRTVALWNRTERVYEVTFPDGATSTQRDRIRVRQATQRWVRAKYSRRTTIEWWGGPEESTP